MIKTWSGEAYDWINSYLRGKPTQYAIMEFKSEANLKKYCDDLIKLIDNMPKEKCLQENTILYRGFLVSQHRTEEQIRQLFKVDETNKLNVFTSTSFDIDVADMFGEYTWDNPNGYILKIYAPKGTKGIAISDELASSGDEYEYLLSPNQKYKTLNFDSKNRIIEIELI